MQPDDVPVDISPSDLRPYFSGFATAEGHFGANTESGHPRFAINLRRDDRAFLEFAQRHFRLGDLRLVPASGGSCPAASWRVGRLADVARLVEILDRYPRADAKARCIAPGELSWPIGSRVVRAPQSHRSCNCDASWRGASESLASTDQPHRSPRPTAHTFGSWREALEACGLPTDASRGADCNARAVRTGASKRSAQRLARRESIAEAVRRCRVDLGHEPAALEFFRWRLQAAPRRPPR